MGKVKTWRKRGLSSNALLRGWAGLAWLQFAPGLKLKKNNR